MSATVLLRPLAVCAALILPMATSAVAQQAAGGGAQAPTQQQGQMQMPSGPMYPGGPAWPGAMQSPMHPGMHHPGMRYPGQPGGPGMPQQGQQQAGPDMQPPMHPGMMQHGPYGRPMPPQGDAQSDAGAQPPQGPQGPMMRGPMYGRGMHHGPGPMGPMGGPMMDGPMGGPMMGGPMGGMCPMGAPDFADGRLAFLKAELGITEQQQAAFDNFAKVVKSHGEGRNDRHEAMMKSMMEAKTPLDRLGARITMMEMRAAMMKEMKGALDGLYGTLSDEQKQKADFLLPGMGGMRCMR